jgi:hypothetical protein
MASIPTTVLDGKGKNASTAFDAVLKYHLDGVQDPHVLDVTAGGRISWDYVHNPEQYNPVFADKRTNIVRNADGLFYPVTNEHCDVLQPSVGVDKWRNQFDAVFYDPPYFFGVNRSDDPRVDDYGGYAGTLGELHQLMHAVQNVGECVKPGGVLILKCADQYFVPEKKLYLHHLDWCMHMQALGEVRGFYTFRYHRVSPTAYQVKNRRSPVIAHTYFIVACKQP